MTNNSIPTWLDPNMEIKTPDQPESYSKLSGNTKSCAFILLSLKSLIELNEELNLGMERSQMLDIIGNSIVETGWGTKWRGWNFGGWKIDKSFVNSYKEIHHVCPQWWRSAGHIAGGDDAVAYYRGFTDAKQFYKDWVYKFVPKNASSTNRYCKTGLAFWAKQNWFYELCVSGYKGEVTKQNPEPSVKTHKNVLARTKVLLAQQILGLVTDASWGPKSAEALKKFQKENGMTPSGTLDDAVMDNLIEIWIDQGMKLNF